MLYGKFPGSILQLSIPSLFDQEKLFKEQLETVEAEM